MSIDFTIQLLTEHASLLMIDQTLNSTPLEFACVTGVKILRHIVRSEMMTTSMLHPILMSCLNLHLHQLMTFVMVTEIFGMKTIVKIVDACTPVVMMDRARIRKSMIDHVTAIRPVVLHMLAAPNTMTVFFMPLSFFSANCLRRGELG